MSKPEYDNHFEIRTKRQLYYALRAGAFSTYEEARANPFDIVFLGTKFRLRFPNGLHATDAVKAARRVHRLPKFVFLPY